MPESDWDNRRVITLRHLVRPRTFYRMNTYGKRDRAVIKIAAASLIGFAALMGISTLPANAGRTVTCSSDGDQYNECQADFRSAVIVRQKSDSPCIRNRTWGYDRGSGTIWVDGGCRAVFGEGSPGRRVVRRYSDDPFGPPVVEPRRYDPYYDRRYRERRDDCFFNGDC